MRRGYGHMSGGLGEWLGGWEGSHPGIGGMGPHMPILSQTLKSYLTTNWKKNTEEDSGIGGILGARGGKLGILGGIISNWKTVLVGVTAALIVLHKAVRLLTEGIQHGTEAYRNAARTGNAVSGQFALSSAFAALGMESPDISQLHGQFNAKSRKFEAPGSDIILGAARAGQLGNMQQLLNMSKEFESAVHDSAQNAREMANVGKALSGLSIQTSELGREWKTLISQIAYMLEPEINGVVMGLKYLLKAINLVAEGFVNIRPILYETLLPGIGSLLNGLSAGKGGNESFSKLAGGGTRDSSTASGLEKMGFVFPGAGNTNYQAAIATNTFKTNTLLAQIRDVLAQLPNGGNGYTQSFPTLPSYAQ